MFDKNYVYFLVKDGYPCFKIGKSGGLKRRLNQLVNYGPYDIKKSKLISINSMLEVSHWEKLLHNRFSYYNMELEIEKNSNGETEWFHIECLSYVIEFTNLILNNSNNLFEKLIGFNKEQQVLLRKINEKQALVNKKFKYALYQYQLKRNNYATFKNLIQQFQGSEILGVDHEETSKKDKFNILCTSNTINSKLVKQAFFNAEDRLFSSSSSLCRSQISDNKKVCFNFEFDKTKMTSKHWTSNIFTSHLKDFFKRGAINSIPKEFYNFVYDGHDYTNTKISFTGNPLIDDFLFDVEKDVNRYLPHNLSNELLAQLIEDFSPYSEEEEDIMPEAYTILIILSILAFQQNFLEKNFDFSSDEDIQVSVTISELLENIQVYFILLGLEDMKRRKLLENYTLPTIETLFKKNLEDSFSITIGSGLIADFLIKEHFNCKEDK